MNTERDKFLTEAMGECWHESVMVEYDNLNLNSSTWEGFGKLLENRKRLGIDISDILTLFCKETSVYGLNKDTPSHFADAIYELLKERGRKG